MQFDYVFSVGSNREANPVPAGQIQDVFAHPWHRSVPRSSAVIASLLDPTRHR
jgi:hypothetical protein